MVARWRSLAIPKATQVLKAKISIQAPLPETSDELSAVIRDLKIDTHELPSVHGPQKAR